MYCSFSQYKVYADIREGSSERDRKRQRSNRKRRFSVLSGAISLEPSEITLANIII